MADKSNSTKPWSSICKLNDRPRGAMTVSRHYQKTKKWVVPQLLEWSSHSLTYEFTQLAKTNHAFHGHHIHPLWWHTLCGLCFSLNPNKSTSYLSLCLTEFFLQWDIKNLSFTRSWNQAPWALARLKSWLDTTEWLSIAQSPAMWVWVPILGKRFQIQFSEMERWWPAQSNSGERSWRMGGKSSGKNVLRNPFHNMPEKLLNAWPAPTIFIGLILGTKEVKDRRTLTHLGNSY